MLLYLRRFGMMPIPRERERERERERRRGEHPQTSWNDLETFFGLPWPVQGLQGAVLSGQGRPRELPGSSWKLEPAPGPPICGRGPGPRAPWTGPPLYVYRFSRHGRNPILWISLASVRTSWSAQTSAGCLRRASLASKRRGETFVRLLGETFYTTYCSKLIDGVKRL